MAQLLVYIQWIIANYQMLLAAIIGVLSSVIVIALLIPGPQPELFLQGVVDFLSKFSRKPPAA